MTSLSPSSSLKIVALSMGFMFISACCGQGSNLLRNDRTKIVQAMRSTVALVREKDPEDGTGWSGRPYCSAFWISRTEIASAAHCFTDRVEVDGFRFELPTQYVGKVARFVSYGQIDDDGNVTAEPAMAKIVWASEEQDVVILKAQGPTTGHPWFRMARRLPHALDGIYFIGMPVGLTWSITPGYVSRIWKFKEETPGILIQTTASIYFGNSGGPLINENGEVIGVTHAIMDRQATINFAVSILEVQKGLRTLHRH